MAQSHKMQLRQTQHQQTQHQLPQRKWHHALHLLSSSSLSSSSSPTNSSISPPQVRERWSSCRAFIYFGIFTTMALIQYHQYAFLLVDTSRLLLHAGGLEENDCLRCRNRTAPAVFAISAILRHSSFPSVLIDSKNTSTSIRSQHFVLPTINHTSSKQGSRIECVDHSNNTNTRKSSHAGILISSNNMTTIQQAVITNRTDTTTHFRIIPDQQQEQQLNPMNNSKYIVVPSTQDTLLVQYGDSIYSRGEWDGSPIVMEQYKLIFFTMAKVGCTIWKQLFRRMMGYNNWREENSLSLLPWNPELNGLRYLYDYNRTMATTMMTSTDWIRAIIVREPMERFLSAYLDKALTHETFIKEKCCTFTGLCQEIAKKSPQGFLQVIQHCTNAHWRPQSYRMEPKYWPYINFVGHLESIETDAYQLLHRIGAWEEFGVNGWGPYSNESIFQSKSGSIGRTHATDARQRLRTYIGPQFEQELKEFFYADYQHPILNITELQLFV